MFVGLSLVDLLSGLVQCTENKIAIISTASVRLPLIRQEH